MKKTMALFLAATMFATMLTGCGGKETNETDGDSNSSGQPEVFKLVVDSIPSDVDWNELWLTKVIEEKFNVDLQIEMISSDIWEEKLPLLFASEQLPDFFLSSLDADDITLYGNEGYLVELSEYISAEKTPNLYKALEEIPALKSANTQIDGSIYNIYGADTYIRERALNRFFINKDWANEILGKQPENLDEFYTYLKGVKERDMNGNGDPNDEIPLGGIYTDQDVINVFIPILCAFGYTSNDIEAIDGKATWVPMEDTYKEFLGYMNKLYTEGLLDAEFFTQTEEQFNAKDANVLYGAYSNWAGWLNNSDEAVYNMYDGLKPMVSEYNSVQMWPGKEFNLSGNFVITKNCKNPEKLIEILDWCFTREGTISIVSGALVGQDPENPEYGSKIEWVDDNTAKIEKFLPENSEGYQTSPRFGFWPSYRDYNIEVTDALNVHLSESIENNYGEYYRDPWPETIKYTTEEADELALLETDITNYTDEMVTKIITGELSLDEFDTFRQGLKDRNIDRVLEIHQTAYDRWISVQ